MLRRLANEAMRSEPSAVKLMLSLVDRYAEAPEATLSVDEVLAEDQAIIARYLPPSPAIQNSSISRKRRKRDADYFSAGRRSVLSNLFHGLSR